MNFKKPTFLKDTHTRQRFKFSGKGMKSLINNLEIMEELFFFSPEISIWKKTVFSLYFSFLKFLLDLKINGINSKAKGNITLQEKRKLEKEALE